MAVTVVSEEGDEITISASGVKLRLRSYLDKEGEVILFVDPVTPHWDVWASSQPYSDTNEMRLLLKEV